MLEKLRALLRLIVGWPWSHRGTHFLLQAITSEKYAIRVKHSVHANSFAKCVTRFAGRGHLWTLGPGGPNSLQRRGREWPAEGHFLGSCSAFPVHNKTCLGLPGGIARFLGYVMLQLEQRKNAEPPKNQPERTRKTEVVRGRRLQSFVSIVLLFVAPFTSLLENSFTHKLHCPLIVSCVFS